MAQQERITGILSLSSDIFDLCLAAVTLTSVSGSVNEKGVKCRRLKDQLDTLERETTDKLAEMEQYNKELKVSGYRQIQEMKDGDDLFSPNQRRFNYLNLYTTQISPGRARSEWFQTHNCGSCVLMNDDMTY